MARHLCQSAVPELCDRSGPLCTATMTNATILLTNQCPVPIGGEMPGSKMSDERSMRMWAFRHCDDTLGPTSQLVCFGVHDAQIFTGMPVLGSIATSVIAM
ncbi:unnamed protein product [Cercospora beticola]|nr:unnamed protein product [Cercospora beticola]